MRFVLDPAMTPELFEDLLDCWTDVTNAGGAVGFVPPVTADEIRPTAEKAFARTRSGLPGSGGDPSAPDVLLIGLDDEGGVGGWLILADSRSGLRAHWRWVLRVMV